MKQIIFGTLIAFSVVACGENNTTEEVVEETVNTESVVEMEKVTEEVSEGVEIMESEVELLAEDIDELLNDI